MNYEERDPYGMYKVNPIGASGSRGSATSTAIFDAIK